MDTSIKNIYGANVYLWAALWRNLEVLQYLDSIDSLLRYDEDFNGLNALDYANMNGNSGTIEYVSMMLTLSYKQNTQILAQTYKLTILLILLTITNAFLPNLMKKVLKIVIFRLKKRTCLVVARDSI